MAWELNVHTGLIEMIVHRPALPGTVRASITLLLSVLALLPCFVWWKDRACLAELSYIYMFLCRSVRAAFDQMTPLSTVLIDLSVIAVIQIYGTENVGAQVSLWQHNTTITIDTDAAWEPAEGIITFTTCPSRQTMTDYFWLLLTSIFYDIIDHSAVFW